jgi:hypothetical protein
MRNVRRHWRGELPCALSLWVIVVLGNLGSVAVAIALHEQRREEALVVLAQAPYGGSTAPLFSIAPWLVVGYTRSATPRPDATCESLSSTLVTGFLHETPHGRFDSQPSCGVSMAFLAEIHCLRHQEPWMREVFQKERAIVRAPEIYPSPRANPEHRPFRHSADPAVHRRKLCNPRDPILLPQRPNLL